MIRWLEYLSSEDRLGESRLIMEERRLQGDFITSFQYLKEVYWKDGERLFNRE